jgi:hypothetical protein
MNQNKFSQDSLPPQEVFEEALQVETLTQSTYDIAVAALVKGPHQHACIRWLLENRDPQGYWGEQSSWHDRYISTYAAAVALYNAGHHALAEPLFAYLPLMAGSDEETLTETLTFGGLIGALDRVVIRRLGFTPPEHPHAVRILIEDEARKWFKLNKWSGFYHRWISIAGFIGESVYADNSIDLDQYIEGFLTEYGSISASPGASALTLLALEEQGRNEPKLRQFVESLNPYQRTVGVLNAIDYYKIAWVMLFWNELGYAGNPDGVEVRLLKSALYNRQRRHLVCSAGYVDEEFPIPPDLDTTATAMLALKTPLRIRKRMFEVTGPLFFNGTCYTTFQYERNASVSTNLHMIAAWPDNPYSYSVLEWLNAEMERSGGVLVCKWHVSPFYAMGELTRLLAHWEYPLIRNMVMNAMTYFADTQHTDGGWGVTTSTHEETAYAVLGLKSVYNAGLISLEHYASMLKRAENVLREPIIYSKLWIGKSLYAVRPVTYMARYAALHALDALRISVTE